MLKKKYSDKAETWYVTFRMNPDIEATSAYVCGDFNDWDKEKHKMRALKGGGFTATIQLDPGQTYRFRYWVDGERWENDWEADGYAANDYGSEDSLVVVDDAPSG